jgi:hypothetical protein
MTRRMPAVALALALVSAARPAAADAPPAVEPYPAAAAPAPPEGAYALTLLRPGFERPAAALDAPGSGSSLALPALHPELLATADQATLAADPEAALTTDRARIILRSLTLPGWGQATLGARTSAWVFGLIEAGIWVSYAAYQTQSYLRTDSYLRTAELQAGIDLRGRDDEFRRIVGSYASSEEYNRLVVYRDAANLYYDDPARYWSYIDANVLRGANTWDWQDPESFVRYQDQRKDAQRSENRANTALALAVANRLASALHASFLASRAGQQNAWRLELAPDPAAGPSAVRWGIRRDF